MREPAGPARRIINVALTGLAWLGVVICAPCAEMGATEIRLKDGRTLEGGVVLLKSIVETPSAAKGAPEGSRRIVMVDNGLCRTFVPKSQIDEVIEEQGQLASEKFRIRQPRTHAANRLNSVGTVDKVEPFDSYGRRTVRLNMRLGPTDVVQVITEITPNWTKLRALDYQWESSIATSSIPRATLHSILMRAIDPESVDDRLKVVRLYLDAENYRDAVAELEQIRQDFPDVAKDRFSRQVSAIGQLGARNILRELRLRQAAGQHKKVAALLENFPTEGVAGPVLREVTEMLDAYTATERRTVDTKETLDAQLAEMDDGDVRDQFAVLVTEIKSGLSASTSPRLAPFRRLSDDVDLGPEQQLALAASGWILGSDGATDELRVVLTAFTIRALITDYLREPDPLRRDELISSIRTEEGVSPELVARLLAQLPPPLPLPEPADGYPGGYVLGVPTVENEPEVEYLLQLPPEYDPNRRYPAIVTLHGESTGAAHQIDWWCGEMGEDGRRYGQAGRHGYIVIAPSWTRPAQTTYRHTAREHAAVLNVLRDAMRRVSIDTDRVYLSGHSAGGDAAWDLGMAHPDLWAGVMPIVAVANKYCDHYWRNLLNQPPVYAVGGELDGDKTDRNSMNYDRLLKTSNYNTTIVEFIGRGHESFSDEIQRLFQWMSLHERDPFPQEFACNSMRPWDNFFWWIEVDQFPDISVVYPEQWPRKGVRPLLVEAKRRENKLRVKTGANAVRINLSPEIVDFSRRVEVNLIGGRSSRRGEQVQPDIGTILEDARTRSDRQHPYWAVLEFNKGKVVQRQR